MSNIPPEEKESHGPVDQADFIYLVNPATGHYAKTTLMVQLAATALNVLRTHQWLARRAKEVLSKSNDRRYKYIQRSDQSFLGSVGMEIHFCQVQRQNEWAMAA